MAKEPCRPPSVCHDLVCTYATSEYYSDDCCEIRRCFCEIGVAVKFEDAAFDFTKWDIYYNGTIPMDRFRFSGDTSLAFPRHFAAEGSVLLNLDCNTSPAFKDLKFVL